MANQQLTGIHAVVTGASSGLGLAMAKALLQAGATVALTARTKERLEKKVQEFQAQGLSAHALVMDVRQETSVEEAVSWVRQQFGKLDVLVNNAGIGMRTVNPRFMIEPNRFLK